MYEDTDNPVRKYFLRTQHLESDIVSDCAAMENLRGSNSDSGIGIDKDELIARDGSNSSKSEKFYNYQNRYDSARTDSGFESFRSDRFNSGDSSCWKMSSDYIPSLSPTEESEIVPCSPNTRLNLETSTYDRFNTATKDVTEQMKNLNFSEPESRTFDHDEYTSHHYYSPLTESYDLFHQDLDGDTVLHLAIIHELSESTISNIIKYLSHSFFLNLQNNLHQTPLHLSVITNNYVVVGELIEAGATVDIRDRRGDTALHIACDRGFFKCAKTILKKSYQNHLELINYEGQTCMHLATLNQDMELIRLLKEFGADVNAHECKSGRTPLHHAVELQNFEIVEFLIKECHADVNAKTFGGLTPIQFAYNRNKKIVSVLLSLGAHNVGLPLSDSESDSSSDESVKMDTIDDSEIDFCVNGQPLKCC